MKRQMVGDVPGNLLGMLADLFHKIQHGIITVQELARFLKRENPFETPSYRKFVLDWEKFYKDNFNLTVDFSGVRIPKCPGIGWRLLIIAQGLSPERVYQISKQVFGKAWKYYGASLDDVVTKNERFNQDSSYAIWVKDGQEADEVHKNKSAIQVEKEKLFTETCLERLIHGLKFFRETGKHLDVKTITLCSGSRYDRGGVPRVYWVGFGGGLSVYWCSSGDASDDLRAREVVS